jgi:hypothetical protein
VIAAMSLAVDSESQGERGWRRGRAARRVNPFKGAVRISAEPAWFQTADAASVNGGYVVRFQGNETAPQYTAYVDGRNGDLITYQRRIWYASGVADVYPIDQFTTGLERKPLENLKSIDKLESAYWSVLNDDGPAATRADGRYIYDPKSTHFDEAQVYYAMQSAMKALMKWGYQPLGASIPIVVHYGDDFANAFYDGDRIVLGDGDCKSVDDKDCNLHNLALDNTVATHEHGHAVFDREGRIVMSDRYGDGPALHEGYADFITCATFNMPTVGEGVMADRKSMRRCDTDIKYSRRKATDEPHDRGQIWSGVMWETRRKAIEMDPEVGSFNVGQMAVDSPMRLKSTGLLGTTSMLDMYRAMLASDKALFDGRYTSTIKAVFTDRGFVSSPAPKVPKAFEWPWPKRSGLVASNGD